MTFECPDLLAGLGVEETNLVISPAGSDHLAIGRVGNTGRIMTEPHRSKPGGGAIGQRILEAIGGRLGSIGGTTRGSAAGRRLGTWNWKCADRRENADCGGENKKARRNVACHELPFNQLVEREGDCILATGLWERSMRV